MLKSGFEDIIEEIIKDVVTGNVILELTNLGHDGLKKVDQKTLANFHVSLSLFNDILHSSINLFQDSLDSWGSGSNLSINNSLDLFKDILQVLSSFHDVSDGKVFLGFELVSKVSKVLANGRDKVLNSMLKSRFEDIIEEIIKDAVTGDLMLNLGQDLLQKLIKESLTMFNASFNISNHFINGLLDLFKDSLDNGSSFSNLAFNNGLHFAEEISHSCLHLSRFNLGLDFIEDILDLLNNVHNFNHANIFNIFTRDKFSNKISQVLLDGRDQIFNGLTKCRLQDIIEKVIKNVVSSNLILQFSQFGHDFFQKFYQKPLSLFNSSFNVSLSLGNHFIDSCIHLFKGILDNRLGFSNLALNNSFEFVQEVNDVRLHFARCNFGSELIENFPKMLSDFHDISNSHVFSRLQLVNKVSKMLTDGGDQVFNGMLQSRFEDIMEQIIKDVISSQVILQFTKLGHDLLQELDKESLALFNSSFSISFGLGNNIFNGGLHLFKSILDNRLSFSNL